jgi:menaquinone-dependent protoporphyrinogen oxidase
MNVLVAVASKHGSTIEIGEAIADELGRMGIEAEVREVAAVADLDQHDAVVLGSAVYMGRWLPAARRFAQAHLFALRERQVWLFSSGPIGDPPKPVDKPPDLDNAAAALWAKDARIFAGRLDPSVLGFGERLVTKAVQAQPGDFRSWEEIRTWARGIGAALTTGAVPATPAQEAHP